MHIHVYVRTYKTHGSGCTEAFFRGHVERETRLREGEGEDGRGGGKEGRRASMTELLRRIRLDGKTFETDGEEEEPTREKKKDEEEEGGEKQKKEEREAGGRREGGQKQQQQQQQNQDREEKEEDECTRHSFASLQNLAFMAPDFSTLCAMKPSPALPSLAVDLVYAYVLAARLYNGCWCSDPVGASLALVAASPVLKDRATPATVGQALSSCVERAVEGEGVGFRGYAESLRQ
ncbi:unnamed protein product, partial [Laminaria digitata]